MAYLCCFSMAIIGSSPSRRGFVKANDLDESDATDEDDDVNHDVQSEDV